jgi:uncharacterized membrane protein YphA (DoxX/SURF4 family)
VVLVHAVGGAALALGFATRIAAALNAVVLLGATITHLRDDGGGSLLGGDLNSQFALLVLVTLAVFVWRGSGRFSLDRVLRPAPQVSSPGA